MSFINKFQLVNGKNPGLISNYTNHAATVVTSICLGVPKSKNIRIYHPPKGHRDGVSKAKGLPRYARGFSPALHRTHCGASVTPCGRSRVPAHGASRMTLCFEKDCFGFSAHSGRFFSLRPQIYKIILYVVVELVFDQFWVG